MIAFSIFYLNLVLPIFPNNMVDPLIVVKTLNHMIPVCTLLVLTTSVLRASMVVRVLGKAALGTLTTLAWLLQPSHKFWEIVSQPLGHDSRRFKMNSLGAFKIGLLRLGLDFLIII